MADKEPPLLAEEPEEGAPAWMVSFADLVSLLLCFFVLLLSFSLTDVAKFKKLAQSMEQAFGTPRKEPTSDMPKDFKSMARDIGQAFDERLKSGDGGSKSTSLDEAAAQLRKLLAPLEAEGLVELETKAGSLVMRLPGHLTFDSGKAEIKPDMVPILRTVGGIVGRTEHDLFVAGHTDNVPIRAGLYKSNLELSAARAASVVDFFVSQGFVLPDRVATMGFGEYRPLVPNDSEAHRRRNRRVEIVLTSLPAFPRDTDPFLLSVPLSLTPGSAPPPLPPQP
jgi:chemotaxis protein MotB